MLGVIVNTLTVIAGSIVGLLAKKAIPKNWTNFIMAGMGLCTMYIGISGAFEGQNTLIAVISIALGAIIGLAVDIDRRVNNLAEKIEKRFVKDAGEGEATFSEGFVTASMIFCVGAMTIVGSLQAGLIGDNTMLFTKATMDGIGAVFFAASLGFGVLASAAFVFVFQGSIVLLAQFVEPFLSDAVIAEMTCAGSLLLIGLAFNLIGISKLKIMNFMPAVFMPIILVPIFDWVGGLF
ncbi:MAG: DUF554 domain-containing protein [Candidatus Fimisoma sp.]|jgi:uncharacterized membrane protein YqgA involved in biofilm formation|nr:DUF554 domain-containing protein [Bacillota bacterium]MDD7284548.1 DUF554 domain-containing protein [Bacillota bacterium]MDY4747589.1 DUF554 domain-containing protein [Candidatus Fimisoma sp.]